MNTQISDQVERLADIIGDVVGTDTPEGKELLAAVSRLHYLEVKYVEVNEYAKRRGNNADGWQERAMKAEAEVKRLSQAMEASARLLAVKGTP